MGGNALGLGPFLHRLEERLAGYTGKQLRAILLEHAEQLPAAEREQFLNIFAQPRNEPGDMGDDHLVDDVAAFVSDIKEGVYTDGLGFDPSTASTAVSATRPGRSSSTAWPNGRAWRCCPGMRPRLGRPTGGC